MSSKDLKLVVVGLLAIIAMSVFVYGMVIVAKNLSYSFFYKDMVQQTVSEMVDAQCLK